MYTHGLYHSGAVRKPHYTTDHNTHYRAQRIPFHPSDARANAAADNRTYNPANRHSYLHAQRSSHHVTNYCPNHGADIQTLSDCSWS